MLSFLGGLFAAGRERSSSTNASTSPRIMLRENLSYYQKVGQRWRVIVEVSCDPPSEKELDLKVILPKKDCLALKKVEEGTYFGAAFLDQERIPRDTPSIPCQISCNDPILIIEQTLRRKDLGKSWTTFLDGISEGSRTAVVWEAAFKARVARFQPPRPPKVARIHQVGDGSGDDDEEAVDPNDAEQGLVIPSGVGGCSIAPRDQSESAGGAASSSGWASGSHMPQHPQSSLGQVPYHHPQTSFSHGLYHPQSAHFLSQRPPPPPPSGRPPPPPPGPPPGVIFQMQQGAQGHLLPAQVIPTHVRSPFGSVKRSSGVLHETAAAARGGPRPPHSKQPRRFDRDFRKTWFQVYFGISPQSCGTLEGFRSQTKRLREKVEQEDSGQGPLVVLQKELRLLLNLCVRNMLERRGQGEMLGAQELFLVGSSSVRRPAYLDLPVPAGVDPAALLVIPFFLRLPKDGTGMSFSVADFLFSVNSGVLKNVLGAINQTFPGMADREGNRELWSLLQSTETVESRRWLPPFRLHFSLELDAEKASQFGLQATTGDAEEVSASAHVLTLLEEEARSLCRSVMNAQYDEEENYPSGCLCLAVRARGMSGDWKGQARSGVSAVESEEPSGAPRVRLGFNIPILLPADFYESPSSFEAKCVNLERQLQWEFAEFLQGQLEPTLQQVKFEETGCAPMTDGGQDGPDRRIDDDESMGRESVAEDSHNVFQEMQVTEEGGEWSGDGLAGDQDLHEERNADGDGDGECEDDISGLTPDWSLGMWRIIASKGAVIEGRHRFEVKRAGGKKEKVELQLFFHLQWNEEVMRCACSTEYNSNKMTDDFGHHRFAVPLRLWFQKRLKEMEGGRFAGLELKKGRNKRGAENPEYRDPGSQGPKAFPMQILSRFGEDAFGPSCQRREAKKSLLFTLDWDLLSIPWEGQEEGDVLDEGARLLLNLLMNELCSKRADLRAQLHSGEILQHLEEVSREAWTASSRSRTSALSPGRGGAAAAAAAVAGGRPVGRGVHQSGPKPVAETVNRIFEVRIGETNPQRFAEILQEGFDLHRPVISDSRVLNYLQRTPLPTDSNADSAFSGSMSILLKVPESRTTERGSPSARGEGEPSPESFPSRTESRSAPSGRGRGAGWGGRGGGRGPGGYGGGDGGGRGNPGSGGGREGEGDNVPDLFRGYAWGAKCENGQDHTRVKVKEEEAPPLPPVLPDPDAAQRKNRPVQSVKIEDDPEHGSTDASKKTQRLSTGLETGVSPATTVETKKNKGGKGSKDTAGEKAVQQLETLEEPTQLHPGSVGSP
uniref:Uncharacterized protein n=1 Tax=Chromera velia CCMP2878 TaxID=1169474 RepID=A0A0G4GQL2_9ALVE|eukprot:Cvel_711.t1-p1 / transcript=Cvel_711.t1 / gene=Cvel_711 / organism=Chromera_velia_CCMP2878 / gene_product=hypothetical protein / transcript_product=hypothetical protein / location=Cvel_scaffold22:72510-80669(-) / protein_length=1287 / sequence_SO=supercontig / SO=protein_coding / is_pseudo=false